MHGNHDTAPTTSPSEAGFGTNTALQSDRRGFLKASGFAVGTVLGFTVPYARNMPLGLVPVALAQAEDLKSLQKEGLTVLADKPLNAETPPHLLDDDITPADRLFVRNNGLIPENRNIADDQWTLTIDGEVDAPLTLTIADLKRDFEQVTLRLQLECAGNGRAFFDPPASGNQWTLGAVGNPEWTGVRLRDVLQKAGIKPSAVYTGHYGNDPHLSGDPDKVTISRGVPIEKAMEPHSMIAWSMNGGDLPLANGYPLRLVCPGWPGSCSQKWLTRIWARSQVHDGEKMTGYSYRVPETPVAPGTEVPEEQMVIIQSMPVKSIITHPQTGVEVSARQPFEVRGHAWAGDLAVSRMDTSVDFGATWQAAQLDSPPNPYSWQRWRASITLPEPGYYEIWARATDSENRMQPAVVPGWNPRGYLNNMQHRIAVFGA